MSSPDLTDAERRAIFEVIQTPNLSMGPQIESFEAAFRGFTGRKYALGVNSGTAGLHLCVQAADIKEGDMVITTPFSFVSSSNVMLFERAIPVFVDVEPNTGNIDTKLVQSAVADLSNYGVNAKRWLPRSGRQKSGKIKAILPVHVYGQPTDMDPILQVAKDFDLKVIEDACEAVGSEFKGRKAGTLGDYSVFAFYPNKQITTGEGGMVVTDDDAAAELMLALRNQGRAPGDTWLQHKFLGYNYRLGELNAALGNVQLSRIEDIITKREMVANWYHERLEQISGVETTSVVPNTTRMSWFVYVIRTDPGISRESISQGLKVKGIPSRPYFIPIHLQPYMRERFGYRKGDFPISEDLGNRCLAIPFSGVMTENQVETVCNALKDTLQELS
jgi:dTDP-4-amino-4,6-dideoxygalactose transaminase